jgi:hypothetical protein
MEFDAPLKGREHARDVWMGMARPRSAAQTTVKQESEGGIH